MIIHLKDILHSMLPLRRIFVCYPFFYVMVESDPFVYMPSRIKKKKLFKVGFSLPMKCSHILGERIVAASFMGMSSMCEHICVNLIDIKYMLYFTGDKNSVKVLEINLNQNSTFGWCFLICFYI